jgi:hypothetical protein
MTDDTMIRIFVKQECSGEIEDSGEQYTIAHFGGVLPVPGDLILRSDVPVGQLRSDPANREMWEVLHRAFNARDRGEKNLGLVVRARPPETCEEALLPKE